MMRNKALLIFAALIFAALCLMADENIGTYTISDTTLTTGDTVLVGVYMTDNTEMSGLWIHNINTTTDSLKIVIFATDFQDSLGVAVDSCMNVSHKYIDLSHYIAPYMILRLTVEDSSATLNPKLILTHKYETY